MVKIFEVKKEDDRGAVGFNAVETAGPLLVTVFDTIEDSSTSMLIHENSDDPKMQKFYKAMKELISEE